MVFFQEVLIQGLLYSILSMGVMISYQVLDIPDLSVDGTFPLGVVVSAVLIMDGIHPLLALIGSIIMGFIAGSITGLLHVKLKIRPLLSGILMMTALYSVNLFLAGGKSNIPLFNQRTLLKLNYLNDLLGPYIKLFIMIVATLLIKFLIDKLLNTRFGYLLKITGDNEQLINVLGQNNSLVKIMGLAISNAIVAMSGGIAASLNGYFDISLGTGMVVLGLSSVILGNTMCRKAKIKETSKVIIGAILYQFMIALALRLNMNPQFLKLATVMIFIIAITLNNQTKERGAQ